MLVSLVVITAMAAAVRLVGIDTLLPQATEPDAIMVMQAMGLRGGDLDPEGMYARKYPLLLAQLISPVMPRPSAAARSKSKSEAQDLLSQLASARLPYVRVRVAVALLSLLMIPLTWLLIRRYLGDSGALLAAALVATSLLHVVNSKQARPHAPAATFILLALIALLVMRRAPDWRTYLLAGIACGAAIASLQNGLLILPAFGVAYLIRRRDAERLIDGWLVLPVGVIATFVLIFYPFAGEAAAGRQAHSLMNVGGLQVGLRDWNGAGFAQLPVFLWQHDPVLMALAVLGLIHLAAFGWRRLERCHRRDLLVLAAFGLPYAFLIGVYDVTQSRYLLPLLPLLAGLAAAGALLLVRVASKLTGLPWVTAGLITVLLLALPAYASIRLATMHAGEDTLSATVRWMNENLEPRDTMLIISPDLDLPVFYARPAIRGAAWGTTWSNYQTAATHRPADAEIWTIDPMLEIDARGAVQQVQTTAGLREFLGRRKSGYMILGPQKELRILKQLAPLKRWVTEVIRFDALAPELGPDVALRTQRQVAFKGYQDERMLDRVLNGVRWGPPVRVYRFDFPVAEDGSRQQK